MPSKPPPEPEEEAVELPMYFMRVPNDFLQQIEEFGAITREGGLTFFKSVNEEVIRFARNSQGQSLYRVYLEDYFESEEAAELGEENA